jgi:hypothetical protein
MSYARRVAVFIGVMVLMAVILVALFVLSARDAVDGARWDIQFPEVPSWDKLQS